MVGDATISGMDRPGVREQGGGLTSVVVVPPATRVLVLGGSGFIGAEVVTAALNSGIDVSILARHRPSSVAVPWSGHVDWHVGDATVRDDVTRALDGVDWVVDAVACPPPAADSAISGGLALPDGPALTLLLEVLQGAPDIGLTYLSSGGAIYGDFGPRPVTEVGPCTPISRYGKFKLRAEHAIRTHAIRFGTPARIVRVANAYGPAQSSSDGQGLVAACMDAAAGDRRITVFGDGSSMRDYVAVADVASAVMALPPGGSGARTVNVGSGTGHDVRQVIELVADVAGEHLDVTWAPSRPQDVHSIVLDTHRLRGLMPWDPTPLADGLAATWEQRQCTAGRPVGLRTA